MKVLDKLAQLHGFAHVDSLGNHALIISTTHSCPGLSGVKIFRKIYNRVYVGNMVAVDYVNVCGSTKGATKSIILLSSYVHYHILPWDILVG